ncbi:MAG: hypothetical protein JXR84_02190 [Anaerolineae bacterium]|nr:hypothetical protein [Anaerolineae bacterium]
MRTLRGRRTSGALSLAVFLSSLAFVALAWGIQVSQAAPLAEKLARPLQQTADVPSISNIAGATYNAERGEIIVFGVADPTLPPLDMAYIRENLAIALRSFYHSTEADIPGVSIKGTLDPLDVIHFGVVTDTRFGQVSFESDRLLKIYTMGADNLTGLPVTSTVTGYMSYPDRMQLLEETVEDPILIRYFFTPTLLIEPITSPHTIIFSQTQKLIDWAYVSEATSPASAEAAQGFVDNFNQYAVSLHQTFHIPQDAQQARLTYWRAVATAETSGPYDYFAAVLKDVSGQTLTTFENLSDHDADNYWHQVSFDVTSYAGQTVQLWFLATTDSSNITNFLVDDISLDYLDLTPPSVVTVAQTPERVLLGDEVTFALTFHERIDTSIAPTVTLSLKDSTALYTVTAKTGTGYTNGYLDNDPHYWYGDYTFAPPMAGGIYTLTVSAAQDLARNVMFPQAAHTLLVTPLTVTLPINGAGTYVFGDTCLELSFAPGMTGALQTVTATLVYTYPTGQGAPYPLPRKYMINGNVDGGFTAILNLCYDDADLGAANIPGAAEASLTLYHYDTGSHVGLLPHYG